MSETTTNEAPAEVLEPEVAETPIEEAPQDTPAEGAEAAAPEAPAEQKFVPLPALREEREARKKAEREVKELASKFEAFQRALLKQAEAPAEPAIPDVNVDPIGHFAAKTQKLEEKLTAEATARQHMEREAAFVATYRGAAAEFSKAAPDFGRAYEHAMGHFRQIAEAIGADATAMERQVVETAMAQGRNPAEAIYQIARAAGYAPATGAQPSPVAAMQRGAQASRSVGTAGAPATGSGLTAERVASMSFDEFRKIPADQIEKLLGA